MLIGGRNGHVKLHVISCVTCHMTSDMLTNINDNKKVVMQVIINKLIA